VSTPDILKNEMNTAPPEPQIAVVISNGWILRNLLETGLLQRSGLIRKITFILDERLADSGTFILNAYGAQYQIVDFKVSRLTLWIKSLLLYIEVFRYAPRYSLNKFRGRSRRLLRSAFTSLNYIGLFGIFHQSMISLFRRCLHREALNFEISKFDLFLSAGPHFIQDNLVAEHAHQAGLPITNVILSWDNIFSKGYMVPADLYVVWGQAMCKQLGTLFAIPVSQTFVLGAPHIGGIKPAGINSITRDTLLYSTAAGVHFPDEKRLVEKLAEDFAAGKFPQFARLVIRTHPAGPNAIYDDIAMPKSGIFVEHPTSTGNREIARWMPETNELARLGEQLSRIAVAVNLASTMSLDCLAHGIHVINITAALDGRDLSRHYRSEHYAALLDLNLIDLAGSYDELVRALQNARWPADRHSTECIQSFIHPTDPKTLTDFHDRIVHLGTRHFAVKRELSQSIQKEKERYV
jgi:hypothetical protein